MASPRPPPSVSACPPARTRGVARCRAERQRRARARGERRVGESFCAAAFGGGTQRCRRWDCACSVASFIARRRAPAPRAAGRRHRPPRRAVRRRARSPPSRAAAFAAGHRRGARRHGRRMALGDGQVHLRKPGPIAAARRGAASPAEARSAALLRRRDERHRRAWRPGGGLDAISWANAAASGDAPAIRSPASAAASAPSSSVARWTRAKSPLRRSGLSGSARRSGALERVRGRRAAAERLGRRRVRSEGDGRRRRGAAKGAVAHVARGTVMPRAPQRSMARISATRWNDRTQGTWRLPRRPAGLGRRRSRERSSPSPVRSSASGACVRV